MPEWRIEKHPILSIPKKRKNSFYWNKQKLEANEGEMISSALFANGIHVFGHHVKDGSPQGIFCANGQCAQCAVIANGIPVKSCMTKIEENMIVESIEGLPELPKVIDGFQFSDIKEFETDVLIVGGGPAGLSAALQLGERGIETLIVDGHDLDALKNAFAYLKKSKKPKAILCKTIKGKGFSEVENKNGWHGKPFDEEMAKRALSELSKLREFDASRYIKKAFKVRKTKFKKKKFKFTNYNKKGKKRRDKGERRDRCAAADSGKDAPP